MITGNYLQVGIVQIHSYCFSLWRKVHQNNNVRQISFGHFEIFWTTAAKKVWQFQIIFIFSLNPKGLLVFVFPSS